MFPLTKEFFYLYPDKPERQKYPPYCKKCASLRSSLWHLNCSRAGKEKIYMQKLHKTLGVSAADYKTLLDRAEYKCEICGKQHKWEASRRYERARLGVDHDHVNGRIRGVLCNKCNAAIGLLQDSVDLVENAATYLRKHKS